jgi:hypothetical protein
MRIEGRRSEIGHLILCSRQDVRTYQADQRKILGEDFLDPVVQKLASFGFQPCVASHRPLVRSHLTLLGGLKGISLAAEHLTDPLNGCVRRDRLSGPPKLDLSLDLVGLHRVD